MDFKSLSKNDQGMLIASAVLIVFSFFGNFIHLSIKGSPLGITGEGGVYSAWSGIGVLGMLLLVAAIAILALKAFSNETLPDGVPWNLVALAASALGLLLLILRGLTAGSDGPGVNYGPGWSAYIVWIAAASLTWFAFTAFQESGDKMPDFNKKDTPPAA